MMKFFTTKITKDQSRDTGMAMVLLCLLLAVSPKHSHRYLFVAMALQVVNMIVPQVFRPVAVVWLVRPGVRESLDGFAIGALAALCFTSAVTLVQAAPEFDSGLVATERPLAGLFSVAITRGVAAPLTAAAVGGMVGATLWFRPRTDVKPARHWYPLTAPLSAFTIAFVIYLAQNGIDYAWIPDAEIVGLYVAVALLALLMLRIMLQCTLLREAPGDTSPNEPVLCPQCDFVVPDLSFCAKCGLAADAPSRSSTGTQLIPRVLKSFTN